MANSVTIRTTAPGAKEAAGQLGMLKAQVVGLGSSKAGPLGGMTSGFGGAGLAMLGAVGAGVAIGSVLTDVGAQLGNAANQAIADEASIASLTQALKTNVPAWDGSMDAIDRVTEAGINLGFADDETRAGIQKLVIANGDLGESLDLATLAFDVSAGTGKDYATAVDIVNKASIGNSKALKQMGIDLGKAATSTELLGALTERFGGQASAATETLAGKLDVTNTKFSEMQESIGYGVLPQIEGFVDYIQGDAIPGLQNLGNTLGDLANGPHSPTVVAEKFTHFHDELTGAGKEALTGYMNFLETRAAEAPRIVQDKMVQPTLAELAKMREEAGKAAHAAGIQITDDLAGALDKNKDVVSGAMDKVKFAITHPLFETRQLAAIEGALTSKQLAAGLNSTNPYVRDVAREQQQILLGQWQSIKGSAYGYGRDAAQQWVSGLGSVGFHVRDPFKDPGHDPGHKGPGGKASGGDLAPGELSWVGENGPELIRTGNGAHVYSNAQSKGMMGGGNINVHVNLSTREFSQHSKHYATMQAGMGGFR